MITVTHIVLLGSGKVQFWNDSTLIQTVNSIQSAVANGNACLCTLDDGSTVEFTVDLLTGIDCNNPYVCSPTEIGSPGYTARLSDVVSWCNDCLPKVPTLGLVTSMVAAVGSPDWDDVQNKPAAFTPATHNHDGDYQPVLGFTPVNDSDPRLSDARTPLSHGHPQSDITNLVTDLAGKAAAAHTHPQSEVTNLVTDLAAKEPANANIQAHIASPHAPADAQKNSDITLAEIEAKLVGVISSHSHAGGGGNAPLLIPLSANFASTSTTRAAVTGWTFACGAGKTYMIEIIADYQSVATTTGGSMGFVLTSGSGTIRGFMEADISQSTVATMLRSPIRAISNSNTLAGSFMTSSGVSVMNSPHSWYALVTLTCTVTGVFVVQWGSEVAGSSTQLNANSSMIITTLN